MYCVAEILHNYNGVCDLANEMLVLTNIFVRMSSVYFK